MKKSWKPPSSVRNAAKRGLKLRKEAPKSKKGGTAVGVARARDLANGKEIPISTIKRMVSFFARHEGNQKGDDKYDRGAIAWDLWGGTPGKAWANRILKKYNKENKKGDNK